MFLFYYIDFLVEDFFGKRDVEFMKELGLFFRF